MKELELLIRIIVGITFLLYSIFSIAFFINTEFSSIINFGDLINYLAGLMSIILYSGTLLILLIQSLNGKN